jgi:hypothetical protein
MPYALFEDGEKLSKAFPTEDEVWSHAVASDLVDLVNGKTVLDDGYTIQPCAGDETIAVPPSVTD